MRNFVILLFIIIFAGCVKEQAKTKYTEIAFNVDTSLLTEEYICPDHVITFNPPKGWEIISLDLLDSIKSNIIASEDSSEFKVVLINVFINTEKTFTCFLSTFESELMADDLRENYLDGFRMINQNISLNEGSFAHNELDFHQTIFVKDNYVTIKLITTINNKDVFMIDYIIPFKYYEEELRAIESSIGTIKMN